MGGSLLGINSGAIAVPENLRPQKEDRWDCGWENSMSV